MHHTYYIGDDNGITSLYIIYNGSFLEKISYFISKAILVLNINDTHRIGDIFLGILVFNKIFLDSFVSLFVYTFKKLPKNDVKDTFKILLIFSLFFFY